MNSPLTLPPISSLLNDTTPRIIIQADQDSYSSKLPFIHSPLLSPSSFTSSLTRSPSPLSPTLYSLPPIHGDDPPRELKQLNIKTKPQYAWNSRHSFEPKEKEKSPELPPFTQIILSESGQAILKRRRGRPPNMKPYMNDGSKHWTFLTPTVWDVNNNVSQNQIHEPDNDLMNGSMAAFTSSSMDMVLQMPRKKRGRKPKSHIEGHSCFVWKDIPASKRAKK